jgi:anionic cell wall polymer biosynthesis LytR-Cps2A-Psr (LCP) family protein
MGTGMNHRRTRQSKRKTILGLIIAVVAVIIFGAVMYAVDVHSRQSEGKGDSGKWTAGLLDGTTLTLDDKNYVYTDDADIYLIIGTDDTGSKPDAEKGFNGNMADFLVLLVQNRSQNTYGFIQLDRDTITDVPVLDENGEELGTIEEQLCIAHWYGQNEEQRNKNTVTTVSRLFGGLPIKGCYSMNMNDVGMLNHVLGGVTVEIEEDMTSVDPQMKKGAKIKLSDEQAREYVRARMAVGDGMNAGRLSRQRQYMQGAYEIVLKRLKEDPEFINESYDALTDLIDSDLPRNEISRIAEQIRKADSKGILTIDGESKIGDTLGNGEEHAEFYISTESLIETLQSLVDLTPEE